MAEKESLLSTLTALEIVNLFRVDNCTAEERMEKLKKILDENYENGITMGLVESLNYVSDEGDRQRLFEEIDKRR